MMIFMLDLILREGLYDVDVKCERVSCDDSSSSSFFLFLQHQLPSLNKMSNKSIANIECGCPMNKIIISSPTTPQPTCKLHNLTRFTCKRMKNYSASWKTISRNGTSARNVYSRIRKNPGREL
jgi:hypothetical protein